MSDSAEDGHRASVHKYRVLMPTDGARRDLMGKAALLHSQMALPGEAELVVFIRRLVCEHR